MRRSRFVAIALLAAVALPTAAAARPNIYTRMLQRVLELGRRQPMRVHRGSSTRVLKSIDLYQQAYSSDFPNAIERALADRASGGCSHGAGDDRGSRRRFDAAARSSSGR